jgi:hypothetical protein
MRDMVQAVAGGEQMDGHCFGCLRIELRDRGPDRPQRGNRHRGLVHRVTRHAWTSQSGRSECRVRLYKREFAVGTNQYGGAGHALAPVVQA